MSAKSIIITLAINTNIVKFEIKKKKKKRAYILLSAHVSKVRGKTMTQFNPLNRVNDEH